MDFEFTEEQNLLSQTARRFMEKEIIPFADEWDQQRPLSREVIKELFPKLRPLGYLDGQVPEELGGGGLNHVSYGVLGEELFRAYASLGLIVMLQAASIDTVAHLGDEYRSRYLDKMLAGDKIGCAAITEPNVGSNPRAIETTATLDGDHYVINGTKTWITNGSVADLATVLVRTKGGDSGGSLSMIFVDREESPFERRELHKLGLRSGPTGEMIFEDCRVPRKNLLGGTGEGLRRTLIGFQAARTMLAIAATGIAQAAIDVSIEYAKQRVQFGKPIGSFQLIQQMIAEMVCDTEASRFLAFRAGTLLDKGVRCSTETSMAKFWCTEAAVRTTSKAIQIHGAYGLSEEFPLERYFRDARSLTIPDGTTQIQKLIIGRDILGLRAF